MKTTSLHTFERDDSMILSSDSAETIFGLLQGQVRPQDTDEVNPHPGLRAYRKIKGNSFETGDIYAFRDFVLELAQRAEASADAVEAEMKSGTRDGFSQRAYELLIEGIRASRSHALRTLGEFVEAFEEKLAEGGQSLPVPRRS